MNRSAAIRWCFKNIRVWPRGTNSKAPDGWRWVISNMPYCAPEYFLEKDGEQIKREDIL